MAVKSSKDSGATTFQTAELDAWGRRLKKVVTNSGDYDATVVYLFDGQKIIETRDGSGNVAEQFIHGTRYIDEIVMMRAIDKGDLYVHQDANWNVIALTDLGGSVVERSIYTPYGQLTVHQETSYGDRDGDQDVDAADKGTPGSTCTGTVSGACRILDLDFDGDYDSTDATKFDALDQGLARHPGRSATGVGQPFAHQGLLYEPEIGSYQNRARQYDPGKRRFVQRDPLAVILPAPPISRRRSSFRSPQLDTRAWSTFGSAQTVRFPVSSFTWMDVARLSLDEQRRIILELLGDAPSEFQPSDLTLTDSYLYGYQSSNPLAYLDPTGLTICYDWANILHRGQYCWREVSAPGQPSGHYCFGPDGADSHIDNCGPACGEFLGMCIYCDVSVFLHILCDLVF